MKRVTLAVVLMVVSGAALTGQVPYQRLVDAATEPGAWLTYSGGYHGQRYSALDQITTANVTNLRPTWVYQVAGQGQMETSAIVADGIMYVTEPPTTVTALDPKNGRPIWSYVRPMPSDLRLIGFPATNRGVAILDDMVYVGSLDGALIALDAQTGAVRWETKVADERNGPLDHHGAAGGQRQGDRRHQRWRGGHSRIRRRLRREDGQARVAHAHGPGERANPASRRGRARAGRTAPAPPG